MVHPPAQRHVGRYGNWCWCGALWLDAGERALYLDRAAARAQGVNAHLRKQAFGEVSRTAEAAESFICIRNTDCSLRALPFTLRNKRRSVSM